jgi:uncharacterized membrane protein YeaQ/YmgE (transglycosylase-associated protein family)
MENNAMMGAATGGVIGLLLVLLLGLVVGAVAKLLMPGKDPGGWLVTMLLGIAGAWVGSFVMGLIGLSGLVPAFLSAVGGAILLLAVYRMLKKP